MSKGKILTLVAVCAFVLTSAVTPAAARWWHSGYFYRLMVPTATGLLGIPSGLRRVRFGCAASETPPRAKQDCAKISSWTALTDNAAAAGTIGRPMDPRRRAEDKRPQPIAVGWGSSADKFSRSIFSQNRFQLAPTKTAEVVRTFAKSGVLSDMPGCARSALTP